MKKTKTCYLTELDVARLEKHASMPGADARMQDMLDELLMRAVTVEARDIPANVVTMNSRATLADEATGEQMTWTVVYPPNADVGSGRLNVFSPAGLALLGALHRILINKGFRGRARKKYPFSYPHSGVFARSCFLAVEV
ncbi:GreA/GreB family elongation factor [Paraburkholderia phenazinium]|uniref:GreA/GreB family elongation factor n=1 Tax=Paraburkholderia phenazinium TaxID=60549 RepID=UPI001589EBB2|nr:GreA/GreB family elongation factor [Paraburkholderia phenazinium]